MRDWESAGLRGAVAVCRTEQETPGFVSRDSFRPDGQLTEKWQQNRDRSEWSIVRRYDDEGRLAAEESTGPHGRTLLHQYDPSGRLFRIDVQSPEGKTHIQESYLYNIDGTSTISKYIDPPLRERNAGVFAESMLHICIDAVCVMTIRDTANRPIKKVFYDADDRIIQRVLLRRAICGWKSGSR